jgi:hypothetical protein
LRPVVTGEVRGEHGELALGKQCRQQPRNAEAQRRTVKACVSRRARHVKPQHAPEKPGRLFKAQIGGNAVRFRQKLPQPAVGAALGDDDVRRQRVAGRRRAQRRGQLQQQRFLTIGGDDAQHAVDGVLIRFLMRSVAGVVRSKCLRNAGELCPQCRRLQHFYFFSETEQPTSAVAAYRQRWRAR